MKERAGPVNLNKPPTFTILEGGFPSYVVSWGETSVIVWCESRNRSYVPYNVKEHHLLPRMRI